MTRRIFIGDIQGCLGELQRLLEACAFDPATDRLHPVGDIVNRGPDSLGCLRLMQQLEAEPVLGNHDLHLLHAAAGQRDVRPDDSFQDVLEADDRDSLLGWLASQPFVRASPDTLLVHAGISPAWEDPVQTLVGIDPMHATPEAIFAVRVRLCDRTGERPASDSAEPDDRFRPWTEYLAPDGSAGRRIIFGHWAARGLATGSGYLGLDTGCVWGGRLTAWIAEEDRLVHVPAERAWQSI